MFPIVLARVPIVVLKHHHQKQTKPQLSLVEKYFSIVQIFWWFSHWVAGIGKWISQVSAQGAVNDLERRGLPQAFLHKLCRVLM